MEEIINTLLSGMYDCEGGYELKSNDEHGICFQDLQNPLCTMTFDDWEQVAEYIDNHQI